jgi:hypothetical protein
MHVADRRSKGVDLIALMASTVSFVLETFLSKGNAEKSITTESNPAFAASTVFASECV